MTGVHDHNSAKQVVDFPDMPDLIGVDSDDGGYDFIPTSLTEQYYGGADVWTNDSNDSEARSATTVKSKYSRSVPSSGLETLKKVLILTCVMRVQWNHRGIIQCQDPIR